MGESTFVVEAHAAVFADRDRTALAKLSQGLINAVTREAPTRTARSAWVRRIGMRVPSGVACPCSRAREKSWKATLPGTSREARETRRALASLTRLHNTSAKLPESAVDSATLARKVLPERGKNVEANACSS